MDLRQTWLIYVHEIRSALRERSIVVGSIVVPVVMYPALLWAMFAGISFIAGQADRVSSRVALADLPEAHQAFADYLEESGRVEIVARNGASEVLRRDVALGRLDALVEFLPPGHDAAAIPNNVQVVISYNEARDRSRFAAARVETAVGTYRDTWVEARRRELGVSNPAWSEYGVIRQDMATPEESSRFLLALVVPFLILITVALAAFYPAVDATAGERERSTWETLMTVAAPRSSVAAAKFLYVATFGTLGGLLNLAALTLTLRWILEPLAGDGIQDLAQGGVPLSALPIIAVGTALLGLFVAAGMLVFAVFAQNFKEGQSMITPFFMVLIIPALFVQSPDVDFTLSLAFVPLVNVAMLIREALLGTVSALHAGVTLLVMAACVAAAVALAQWIMRREEVLFGSTSGGFWRYLRRHVAARWGKA